MTICQKAKGGIFSLHNAQEISFSFYIVINNILLEVFNDRIK